MLRVKKYVPYMMISVATILLLLFRVAPLRYSLLSSIYIDGHLTLKAFENLFFHDTVFWKSMLVTLKLNVVLIPVQIVVSFLWLFW